MSNKDCDSEGVELSVTDPEAAEVDKLAKDVDLEAVRDLELGMLVYNHNVCVL
jgi:hypothetical protein